MKLATLAVPLVALAGFAAACEPEPVASSKEPLPPAPAVSPSEAVLKRLTRTQYRHTVRDLLGDVAVPASLEPDVSSEGFFTVGASQTSISALGVDRYESAAFDIAAQAMKPGAARNQLVPCKPADIVDEACARAFVTTFGRKAFRRPMDATEVDRYATIAAKAAETLGNFHKGLEFALAGMLQSPHFLFRVEVGEEDPATGKRRYSSWEMATRLAYFLWSSTPDDELLDAAARGDLLDDASLARAVERMLASPRARDGVRNFFDERFGLHKLADLVKDPLVYPQTSADLGPDAREETLRTLEDLVFDRDADVRQMMTSPRTFLNRRLATLYGVPAPAIDGFAATALPYDGPRRGLLGHASLLAGYAHPTSSSATLRGKFLRTVLLCGTIPPPPANVNTSLPEPSPDLPTARDRLRQHVVSPDCKACHLLMDPLGFGLERFDGLAQYRTTEQGAAIDPSGELDGTAFTDARELAAAVASHPDFPRCLTRHVYRYATGRLESAGEEELLGWLNEALGHDEFRLKPLLKHVVMSEGFRLATEAP
ncbi:MAG: DUF1592 domain-containing protein [Deltaproteobacteria bacterium]|nr:DUF1592 domain-containing protein [Deltaproteobacteria bacterium]